jgi:transposase
MKLVIGVDVHKRNHTFVVVDQNGQQLGVKAVAATSLGHVAALQWVRSGFTGDRLWGVEDVRPLSTRLEVELLESGEAVVRVPPRLTARHRAIGRAIGKSDPIDALAVARAVLREPDLPIARHDRVSRELKLLVDRRSDLVNMRTAMTNRLLGRLHELDPEAGPPSRSIKRIKHREAVLVALVPHSGVLADIARDEMADFERLTNQASQLEKRIAVTVGRIAPSLLAISGCGVLTAAKIIGETADVARFPSEPKFASYIGLAPMPHSSGGSNVRFRGSKHGNRQLNSALHTIGLMQIRKGANPYYQRRVAEGETHALAMRCLKRRLCRIVYRSLVIDRPLRSERAVIGEELQE